MSQYESIDPVLSDWAIKNSLVWLTEYQDSEVRTVLLGPENRERVQIWVDPPKLAHTKVHVFQQKAGRKTKKLEEFSSKLPELYQNLDKALHVANAWLMES